MFDKKKLEAFLDGLEVETHFPKDAPRKIVAPPRSALDAKMDKYDIFKQDDYENVGTVEFPVLVKRTLGITLSMLQSAYGQAMFPTYGSVNLAASVSGMMSWSMAGFDPGPEYPPPPKETPYDRLKAKLARLEKVAPAKVADPAPPAPAKSPDFVHTITAWRGWEVDDGLLTALGCDYDWEPKVAARARCRNEHHAPPQAQCSCGFWSFKTFDGLLSAMGSYASSVQVIGTVEIWGRVIECENGFRSEFAYPKELWLLGEGLESLSWTYGVPVRKLA